MRTLFPIAALAAAAPACAQWPMVNAFFHETSAIGRLNPIVEIANPLSIKLALWEVAADGRFMMVSEV